MRIWVAFTIALASLSTLGRVAAADSSLVSPGQPARAWTERFDLDGDGRVDPIDVHFSRGAHCCYTLGVKLSRSGRLVELPFWMDGGYVFGFDLSRPEHFDVRRPDGESGAALFMEISTYAGRPEPLPRGRVRVENL